MASKKTQLLLFFFLFLLSPPIISFSLPTEFSILNQTPSEDNLLSEDPVVDLFQQWMGKYGKVYNHPGEFEIRLENFRTNFNYVTEKNAQRRGYSVGLNTFADMSNEEFKQKFSSKIKKPVNTIKVGNQEEHLLKCDAPPSLDWRQKGAVTGVKNQGICGSCWAFSATGAIEGINAIKTGNLISVSEQELIDCDKTNDGCSGGYMDNALQWVVDNGGINTEADYPYTANNDKCNTAKKDKKIVTIDGIGEVVPQTESKLFCAVVNQPVSVGIQGSSLDFMLYTGGIFDGYCCSGNPEDINHAVLIVGYASSGDKDYWIVKNSWGTGWGMEGYGYIKRNTNLEFGVCAINSRASYPTKQSVSPPSPDPESPPPLKPRPDNWCDLWYYCPVDQTCCCTFSFLGICYIYNCCNYENAVCCYGKPYCCPYFNPICDTKNHRCLQSHDDKIGIPAKKMKTAELKLPWTKYEEAEDQCPLEEKRNHLASVY